MAIPVQHLILKTDLTSKIFNSGIIIYIPLHFEVKIKHSPQSEFTNSGSGR